MRKDGLVSKYLEYFSEATEHFSLYRDQIHTFTKQLHQNYIDCYIKKKSPLINFPEQYRRHMFNLHKRYLDYYRSNGEKITQRRVIEYINNLNPSHLMFSINFHMRHQNTDNAMQSGD